jgi:hypothetical protein
MNNRLLLFHIVPIAGTTLLAEPLIDGNSPSSREIV